MTIFVKINIRQCWLIGLLCLPLQVFANQSFSPSDVFSLSDQSNRIIEQILEHKSIVLPKKLPLSRETAAKPMHVYEMSTVLLQELYEYAHVNKLSPPPIVISTPIQYKPSDVYKVLAVTRDYLVDIKKSAGISTPVFLQKFANKNPADVYQNLFELYYKINLLNGRQKVSPNEVFSQVSRAKDDLRTTLITLARRLDDKQERTKRQLYTAAYGINVDGTAMPPFEGGKVPADPLRISFEIRGLLNELRSVYGIGQLKTPSMSSFSAGVAPIDVFLQSQFIIAEINTIKEPLSLFHTMNRKNIYDDKTPSDVYYELVHMKYMLERLVEFENSKA